MIDEFIVRRTFPFRFTEGKGNRLCRERPLNKCVPSYPKCKTCLIYSPLQSIHCTILYNLVLTSCEECMSNFHRNRVNHVKLPQGHGLAANLLRSSSPLSLLIHYFTNASKYNEPFNKTSNWYYLYVNI